MRAAALWAAHEVWGHTLGLGCITWGELLFPVDLLCSPSFAAEIRHDPSIMDYARNNYVAQRGDFERGGGWCRLIGVYDICYQLGLPHLREDARCRGGVAAAQRPLAAKAMI